MTIQRDIDFQAAASHHHELSERQLEVLVLIDRGLTNGEIAEALEITLDGAKWNVSEILTKLALLRREDAAAYYRWYRSPIQRLSRHARALMVGAVGLGAAGVAAGGPSMGMTAGLGITFMGEVAVTLVLPSLGSAFTPGGNVGRTGSEAAAAGTGLTG